MWLMIRRFASQLMLFALLALAAQNGAMAAWSGCPTSAGLHTSGAIGDSAETIHSHKAQIEVGLAYEPESSGPYHPADACCCVSFCALALVPIPRETSNALAPQIATETLVFAVGIDPFRLERPPRV